MDVLTKSQISKINGINTHTKKMGFGNKIQELIENEIISVEEIKSELAEIPKQYNGLDGYNIQSGLRNFNYALADVDNNPVKITVVGDSVAYGAYSSNNSTTSWCSRLRTVLQNILGNVGIGMCAFPYVEIANKVGNGNPWSYTGTWAQTGGMGVTGRVTYASGTDKTATLIFTGTRVDLIYWTNTTGASSGVSITIDGVAVTIPNFYSTTMTFGLIQSYTGLSNGSHTLIITAPSSNNVQIEGAYVYNPISSAGAKGCYVNQFTCPNATAVWYANQISKMNTITGNTHLAIIALAINDARANSATYVANMTSIITAFKSVGASVLLIPYFMINDTTAINANYITMINQMYTLADQYNCAIVDIYERWQKSWTIANSLGLMGTSVYNGSAGVDQWHPSDKGHRDIANAIAMNLIGKIS